MAQLSWLPFTSDWRYARQARAEQAWEEAVIQHRSGDPAAAGRMRAALGAGAKPTWNKAKQALETPAPEVLQRLLKANPTLHPLADPPDTNPFGDTLLHVWARVPDRGEPSHERITQLLLTPVNPKQFSILMSWNVRGTLLRMNQEKQDSQMLAAQHGNWALLKGLAQHLKESVGGVHTDMRERNWVDHWTDGVLERQAKGQPLRLTDTDPALSALKVCLGAEGALLGRKNSWYGAPVARLLAAGIDWRLAEHLFPSRPDANPEHRSETSLGNREGPIDPAHFRAYSALSEALLPNAGVHGTGIVSHYLAGAMVSTQPMEALEWVMEGMSHFRADPREQSRQCNLWAGGKEKHRSPAYPWLAKPERLAVALERKWLEATTLAPDNLPELPTLLVNMLGKPDQDSMARRILEALGRNYPAVMETGYKSLVMADHLENTLETPALTKARQRL